MIVYSHTVTPRLQYIINFLSDYFKHPFKLTANEQAYAASEDFKINYSYQKISSPEIYINPHALLFEYEKRKVQARCFQYKDYTAFFETVGDLHFDLFAALFFLLSRYEEYLPHEKDAYGRFDHKNSLAFKEGFLQQPLINIWLEDFAQSLEEKFPGIQLQRPKFSFLPTYDIDIAWAYKNKGFKRTAGPIVQSLFKGKWKTVGERIRVLKGKETDPFDAYAWMDELHERYGLHPLYFFLVAEENGKYDKNIDPNNEEFRQLIKSISSHSKIGLHPSWSSGDNKALIAKEKKRLEEISQQSLHRSRQHYIRMQLPATYQQLLSAGITEDHSMGYGSINGFRASIALPFYWYDLQKEEITRLLIHPFCFMDANAHYEQKLSPQQASEELMNYYKAVKAVNGTMITIWHNQFLGTGSEFEGWKEMYEEFVRLLTMEADGDD